MPPGVVVTQRIQAAGMRAAESHAMVRRVAQRLSEEIDEITGPVSPRPSSQGDFLDEEDSLVVVVSDVLARAKKG